MGVKDKLALLRDGSVNLTATEAGAPATAGTFVFDTATGAQVPSGGVVSLLSRTGGPGTSRVKPIVVSLIVPIGFPTGATPSITAQLEATDDTALVNWERLLTFSFQTVAGALVTFGNQANPLNITVAGEYRQGFTSYRRFYRHNILSFAGTSFGGVIIALELAF